MAVRRIKKEFEKLSEMKEQEGVTNIKIEEYLVTVTAPKESPYFPLEIGLQFEFPPDYPFKPPKINLRTQIFHPQFGERIDIKGSEWGPQLMIWNILRRIRTLLVCPSPGIPIGSCPSSDLNKKACDLFETDIEKYLRELFSFHKKKVSDKELLKWKNEIEGIYNPLSQMRKQIDMEASEQREKDEKSWKESKDRPDNRKIKIDVKLLTGRTFTFNLSPSTQLGYIYMEIHQEIYVPFRILFAGKIVSNELNSTLEQLKFSDGTVLHILYDIGCPHKLFGKDPYAVDPIPDGSFKAFILTGKVSVKKLKLLVEHDSKVKSFEVDAPSSLDMLSLNLKKNLKIANEEKIRMKILDKTSAEFIVLERLEQVASESVVKVFSKSSLLSNIRKN